MTFSKGHASGEGAFGRSEVYICTHDYVPSHRVTIAFTKGQPDQYYNYDMLEGPTKRIIRCPHCKSWRTATFAVFLDQLVSRHAGPR